MVPLARVVLAGVLIVGCAEGSSIETGAGSGGGSPSGVGGAGGRGGASGSDDDDTSSSSSSPTGGTTSSQTPDQSAGPTSSSSGGDGGAGDGGAGGGGDATTSSTTTSSTGIVCNFTSPNDCAGAEDLGAIAGDEDGTPITVQGVTSKWFTIWIEERSSSISETDLSYRVALVSPAGMNYDLIVHEGPQDGGIDCNAAPKVGAPNGNGEEVTASWDDDQGIGGQDDSVHLSIEVRYLSGEACAPSDSWTLTLEGHI